MGYSPRVVCLCTCVGTHHIHSCVRGTEHASRRRMQITRMGWKAKIVMDMRLQCCTPPDMNVLCHFTYPLSTLRVGLHRDSFVRFISIIQTLKGDTPSFPRVLALARTALGSCFPQPSPRVPVPTSSDGPVGEWLFDRRRRAFSTFCSITSRCK